MISIVILNYNGKNLLKECFDSVLEQSFSDFEIVFVDNNSTDGSVDYVKKNFTDQRIKIIRSERNLGFAGGNNLGYKNAAGEFIVLLNNDTIVDKDWLKKLYELISSDDNIGIAQSLVITEGIPEKYYKKNGTINLLGHNIMEVFAIGHDGVGEIFQATGCSLIIKKSLVDNLGGLFLDEYFAYAEDTYLSFKVKFYGKKIMHTSNSIVRHKGNATSAKQKSSTLYFFQERNRLLNFFLFLSKGSLVKYIPFFVLNFFLKIFASILSNKYSVLSVFKAYWWLLTNYLFIKDNRKKLLQCRRVPEDDVLKFISGKISDGESIVGRIINYVSLFYCRIVGLNVVEINKS